MLLDIKNASIPNHMHLGGGKRKKKNGLHLDLDLCLQIFVPSQREFALHQQKTDLLKMALGFAECFVWVWLFVRFI